VTDGFSFVVSQIGCAESGELPDHSPAIAANMVNGVIISLFMVLPYSA
jgi:hypothetical protein